MSEYNRELARDVAKAEEERRNSENQSRGFRFVFDTKQPHRAYIIRRAPTDDIIDVVSELTDFLRERVIWLKTQMEVYPDDAQSYQAEIDRIRKSWLEKIKML